MQRITTVLTFDGRAEEAVDFYTSVFPNSRLTSSVRSAGRPGTKGKLRSATFELAGQEYIALNDGCWFGPSQGISLFVDCEEQEEVDDLWEKLTDGGEAGHCGWLTDRFGVSWQIVPRALGDFLEGEDAEKATRALRAVLQMRKIEIGELQRADEGAEVSPNGGGR
jgi:predicted 3-demethylubiquinone-9 3-methyltransferase (glyoxalase superfamily)